MTRCRTFTRYIEFFAALIVPTGIFLQLVMVHEAHREHQRFEQEGLKTLCELKPSADCESATPHGI